mmetsp:Transcript_55359/g.129555  ORF Transcript_55359/g.129555 Transcript_55359/m.129555 type:complete len:257 (-) Transcript_55359:94-864(-)
MDTASVTAQTTQNPGPAPHGARAPTVHPTACNGGRRDSVVGIPHAVMQQQTRPALRLRGLGLRVRRGSDEGSDGTEPALDGGAAARAGGREGADGVVHVVGGKAFLAALRPREHAGPADHVLAREQHHRPLDLGPVREAGRALVVVEPSLLAGRGPAVDALHHDRRPALGLALLLGRPLVLLRALPLRFGGEGGEVLHKHLLPHAQLLPQLLLLLLLLLLLRRRSCLCFATLRSTPAPRCHTRCHSASCCCCFFCG